MQAARKFYAYCYRTGKAEIWDAGYAQLKAAVTEDEGGRVLLSALKRRIGRSEKNCCRKFIPWVSYPRT